MIAETANEINCLFGERDADQMFSVARYIRLCCQMCNESHLAPHSGLQITLIVEDQIGGHRSDANAILGPHRADCTLTDNGS